MTTPAISLIIPTYNRARLLGRALRSALAQLGDADEILVVDDASTDDTARVLADYAKRVRHVKVEHGGAGKARNAGVRLATRPLIAFLDSDDEWLPNKIRLQRAFLQARPDVLFCFSDFVSREDNGIEVRNYLAQWHQDPRPWDEILAPGVPYSGIAPLPEGQADFPIHVGDMFLREMESDYILTSSLMVRRVEAGDALHFAEDLPVSEDKECFARIARAGLGAYMNVELACQWGHGGGRLSVTNTHALTTARLKLLERIWGADPAFLARHGEEHARAVAEQHRKRAQWLLVRGRTQEARADLRAAHGPLAYRMLARLPGSVVRGMFGLRRLLLRRSRVTS